MTTTMWIILGAVLWAVIVAITVAIVHGAEIKRHEEREFWNEQREFDEDERLMTQYLSEE